jgi:hypothetical protein
MPSLLNNPAHWHLRAQEARLLASQLEDPEAKAATLKVAGEYDRLAVRAARRIREEIAACRRVALTILNTGVIRLSETIAVEIR